MTGSSKPPERNMRLKERSTGRVFVVVYVEKSTPERWGGQVFHITSADEMNTVRQVSEEQVRSEFEVL